VRDRGWLQQGINILKNRYKYVLICLILEFTHRDELMLGCEIRLVQRAFKVATEEPHKFGITLMKNMFEMFPLLIDRFELFNSLPLHEIVAKPEFRRYGMAATYAVVPVVGSIHDDIACILECEKWVKGEIQDQKQKKCTNWGDT
jgi:hypothetical protein